MPHYLTQAEAYRLLQRLLPPEVFPDGAPSAYYHTAEFYACAKVIATAYESASGIYQNFFPQTCDAEFIGSWEVRCFGRVNPQGLTGLVDRQNVVVAYMQTAAPGISKPAMRSVVDRTIPGLTFEIVAWCCGQGEGGWVLDESQLDVETYLNYDDVQFAAQVGEGLCAEIVSPGYADTNRDDSEIVWTDIVVADWDIPFSISCCARSGDTISWQFGRPTPSGCYLSISSDTSCIVALFADPGNAILINFPASADPAELNNYVVTYDGSGLAAGLKLYVNGVEQIPDVQTDSLGSTSFSGTLFKLEALAGANWDNFGIYTAELTAPQVAEIATAGKSSDLRSLSSAVVLAHCYPLDGNSADTVTADPVDGVDTLVEYFTYAGLRNEVAYNGLTAQQWAILQTFAYTYEVRIYGYTLTAAQLAILEAALTVYGPARSAFVINDGLDVSEMLNDPLC